MRDDINVCNNLKHDANTGWNHRQPTESSRSFSRTDRRSITSSSNSSNAGRRRWPHTLIITIRYRAVITPTE
ncbi:hypothetical protein V3C99_003063 [Haemonchus contortus]|uniref:Uncharacterized protein n=1 Tax=Haemonchus contortus TaxID=6289 RepID=A0A7I4Y7C0_HAECO